MYTSTKTKKVTFSFLGNLTTNHIPIIKVKYCLTNLKVNNDGLHVNRETILQPIEYLQ